MGAEKQAKSRVGRRQGRHAPRRATARQGQPARRRTLSRVPRRILAPAGHLLRRFSQCRFRLSPGDARGEAPCIRKLKTPPSRREGGRGDGGKKASKKQGWQATRKARPPPGNGKARSASEAKNSFKSPPAHPRPKNAAGARQATGGRRRRTDPPNAEGKAGGREPRCTGHPEAQPRRDPPESG